MLNTEEPLDAILHLTQVRKTSGTWRVAKFIGT